MHIVGLSVFSFSPLNICSYCGFSLYFIAGVFMGEAAGDISISR